MKGFGYSWGIIQARLASKHLAADSTLASTGSIAIASVSFGAILNTRLIRFLGVRNATLLACSLIGASQFLSGWATKSVGAFTNCVLLGMGASICVMANYLSRSKFVFLMILPSMQFTSRPILQTTSRVGQWLCIIAAGGLGGCVLSLAMEALLTRVSVAWTFRILGFITLAAALPAAMLLKERTRRQATTIDW